MGALTGGLMSPAGTFVVSEVFDFFAGTAVDMAFNGMSRDEAVLNNAVGLGFGRALGLFGAATKRASKWLGDIDVNVKPTRNTMPEVCGVNSFSAETNVATSDGDVPISDIEIGDSVLAYHEGLDETGEYIVTDTISHIDPEVVYLTISGETLTTTLEHPFYTADGEWINAGDLAIGEEIQSLDGTIGVVEMVEVVSDPQPMYNLTVADAHTFFVGDGQWLVHNTGGDDCANLQKSQGIRIALGLKEDLFDFANKIDGKTFRDWSSPENIASDAWRNDFMEVMNNIDNSIHMNLTGVDNPLASAQRAASINGRFGATDWELYQIKIHENWWSRITFYIEDKIVPNPFAGGFKFNR